MGAFRAAVIAALFLLSGAAGAQDVAFTSRDGSIELEGNLLGFDGEYYRVETVYGELTLDASGVSCEGPGCPSLADFVAELRISGSSGIAEFLMPALLEAFAQRNGLKLDRNRLDATHETFELFDVDRLIGRFSFRATNTDEGFADLLADEADVAIATREVRRDEVARARAAGLGDLNHVNRSRVIALDGLVAVTAPGHPVTTISIDQLSQVVAGRIANWSELGGPDAPIEVHLPSSSTGLSQAIEDQILLPRRRQVGEEILRYDDTQEIGKAVSRDFLGLGVMPYSAIGNAAAVTLRGTCGFSLRPTRRTIKTEDYPLTAPLFLYLPARRLPKLARDFLTFLRSDPAQIVIRRAGFVDQSAEELSVNDQGDRFTNAISVTGEDVTLAELKRMTNTLTAYKRLTTSFRFETGSARLDAQSRSNVRQLARSLEAGVFDGRSVLFVGFSDGQGAADINRGIAEKRAVTVRRAVEDAAETANLDRLEIAVDAFGEALPMACDDTDWGRGVNRRVEVWVR